MLSNQWLTEIALRRVVTRRKTGNNRATDFRVEKQYVNPVTCVTPKNNIGGNRFAVSREQKFEFVHCSSCHHAIPATPRDPWCWHRCAAGVERGTGWGMAPRVCERWERKP